MALSLNNLFDIFSLTDLQNQLTSVLLKQKQATDSKEFQSSFCVKQKPENVTTQPSDIGKKDACSQIFPGDASLPRGMVNVHIMQVSKPTALSEMMSGRKRKRNPVIVTPAWCYSEASSGIFLTFCGLISLSLLLPNRTCLSSYTRNCFIVG